MRATVTTSRRWSTSTHDEPHTEEERVNSCLLSFSSFSHKAWLLLLLLELVTFWRRGAGVTSFSPQLCRRASPAAPRARPSYRTPTRRSSPAACAGQKRTHAILLDRLCVVCRACAVVCRVRVPLELLLLRFSLRGLFPLLQRFEKGWVGLAVFPVWFVVDEFFLYRTRMTHEHHTHTHEQ